MATIRFVFLQCVTIGLLTVALSSSLAAQPVADFSLPSATDGSLVRLSDHSGKVVLINWWRTSCAYCQREMPKLVELYEQYRDDGLVVIGVSDDSASYVADIPSFLKQHEITWPVGLNDQAEFQREIRPLGSGSTPCNYLVSRSGEITFLGLIRDPEQDWKKIEQGIVEALAQPAPDQPAIERRRLDPVPDFTLRDLGNKEFRPTDFAGKPLVVTFFTAGTANWAGDVFTKLHQDYSSRGLQVLGINLFDKDEAINQYIKTYDVEYPVLRGDRATQKAWIGSSSAWATFFVTPDGKIFKKIVHAISNGIQEPVFRKYSEYLVSQYAQQEKSASRSTPSQSNSTKKSDAITLLLTADTEGHVSPCQSCPGEKGLGGLAERATSLWRLNANDSGSLILDAGNALFGGQSLSSDGEVIVAAYNRIGYDAVQLTDADFFRGKDGTIKLIEQAEFPFVSANIVDADSGQPLVEPFVVKEVVDQRVAIIGVCQRPRILDMGDSLPSILAPRIAQWNGLDIHPAEEALAHWLPQARQQADRIILMYRGSPFGLRSIVKKFGEQVDAICVSGIRPHHVSEDAKPPIIATSMHGQHIAHARIADDGAATVEQIPIEPTIEPNPEMQQLLAKYTTTQPPPESVAVAERKMSPRVTEPVPDPVPNAPKLAEPGKRPKPEPEPSPRPKPSPTPKPSPSAPASPPKEEPVELLVNPSNELPLEDGQVVGWTAVKGNQWAQRGENPAPHDGQYYFYSGENQSAELRQDVDVSRFADSIAAGKMAFHFSGYVRSYDADSSQIVVEYRDQENETVLDRFDSRPIANKSYWQRVSDMRLAPPKTGWIRIRLISTRHGYSSNDGYYDGVSLQAIDADAVGSGIEFVGRSENDRPPTSLFVYKPRSDQYLVCTGGRWGDVRLLPGKYQIKIQPTEFFPEPLDWGEIEVPRGKAIRVTIDSGIQVSASGKKVRTPESWYLHKAGNDEPLMDASGIWGFTSLPPGDYEVRVKPRDLGEEIVTWTEITVEPSKVIDVSIDSGIELLGRDEHDRPPQSWYIYKSGSDDKLTYVRGAWGATPLPPGKYEVRVNPGALGKEKVSWGEVEVDAGEVVELTLDSGIELRGRDRYDRPPKYWYIYKSGSDDYLTYIAGNWGVTPLPPGDYDVRVTPGRNDLEQFLWASVTVKPGEVEQVQVASGIAMEAPDVFYDPPDAWQIHDAASDELVTTVSGGWCFSPLLPGSYYVTCSYDDSDGKSETLEVVEDQTVSITLQDLGIEPPPVPVEDRTGIALSGRSPNEKPPKYWILYDADTDEEVARVGGPYGGQRWGLLKLPPGTYRLSLVPHDSGAMEIIYAKAVSLKAGQVIKIQVNSGIELAGRNRRETPPDIWYVYDRETNKKVAQVGNQYGGHRWGFTPLPPGKYRVSIFQGGPGSMEVPYQEFDVAPDEVVSATVDSGVELVGGSESDPPPKIWSVFDADTDEQLAQVGNHYRGHRWGYTPLPPGTYRVVANYQGAPGRSKPIRVDKGEVKRISVADLQIAEFDIELPASKNVSIASGRNSLHVLVVKEELRKRLNEDAKNKGQPLSQYIADAVDAVEQSGGGRDLETPLAQQLMTLLPDEADARGLWSEALDFMDGTPRLQRWIPVTGKASLFICSGRIVLEQPINLDPGERREVPFNARALAERHQLVWFEVESPTITRVIVMDPPGEKLIAFGDQPVAQQSWLAHAGSTIRLQGDNRETLHLHVPPGELIRLGMDRNRNAQPNESRRIQVDIAIQTPEDRTVVESDRVTLTGLASTTGPAGSTRIAVIIDASGSAVEDSSGADLDDDGEDENILEAEVVAARRLLEELGKVEAAAAGKTFDVAILRFADDADVMAPLLPLSDPASMPRLSEALDKVVKDGSQGGTNFEPAIDEAMTLFQASEREGPKVIVFMSDGYPWIGVGRDTKSGVPEGLDAASRAGLRGVEFHGIGLGKDFMNDIDVDLRFPPYPPEDDGAAIIAHMAACGAPGSTATALPVPAEVVQVVSRLPVIELPEAELKEVTVVNKTTGEPAFSVNLDRKGYFEADVPVSLIPLGEHGSNVLEATAIAKDERFTASDRVTVLGKKAEIIPPPLRDDGPVNVEFEATMIPAIQLVLDSSGSMLKFAGDEPKYVIAERVVDSLINRLPDKAPVGFRLYGHLGFWTRPESPRAGLPPRRDPRWLQDSELVSRVAPLDAGRRSAIKQWLDWAHPRGLTPLVYSLMEARKDFPSAWDGPKIIILVSDGKETCGGDLDDVNDAFADDDIVIHVVGFDIDDDEVFSRRTLERIAQFGGGQYFTANTANELSETLQRAVRSPGYEILGTDGKRITRMTLGGPAAKLQPGRYQIKLIGGDEDPLSIDVTEGNPLTLTLTEEGELTVANQQ